MRIVIVTGMSGAGKSSVLRMLEDVGYFCVDNIPIALIPKFVCLSVDNKGETSKLALGVDIRSGNALDDLDERLEEITEIGYDIEILYLDASTEVLVKRYKETRRNHPLSRGGRVDKVIETERTRLNFLKEQADYIIDTSKMLVRELKAEIDKIFVNNQEFKNFYITVVSFGFKYGIPTDADLVFDVRFLQNPYYISELKPLTGNDAPVYEYVMNSSSAPEFMTKLTDMVNFLIPRYIEEGKNHLVIGIGCTGGKHRSVTVANALFNMLKDSNYGTKVEHRDIEKDAIRKKL